MSDKGFEEFEWEIREGRDGNKTLLLGGRAIYSTYRPVEHAESTARSLIEQAEKEKSDHLIIIGLGLGYLPRALYDLGCRNVVVWEPFPVMQKSFPVCGGKWEESVSIVNDYNSFEKKVMQVARKGAKPRLLVHPGYNTFCRLEHRQAITLLNKIYGATGEPKYIMSRRTLDTFAAMPFLSTVKDFRGVFRGKRAILVSPGPSLKSCIPVLKNVKNSIIFSALQSAPYLQKNGINPHFITCADPTDMGQLLNDCGSEFGVFLAESSCHPSTLEWNREKTFLFHFRCGQLHELLWEGACLPVIEDPVCTVSEVMLLLADYMGVDEIYCLGMDLCWRESPYSYRINLKADEPILSGMTTTFSILANDGRIAKTKPHYFHSARYLKQQCSELKTRSKVLYQMKGGIDINVTANLTPDELQEKLEADRSEIIFDVKNSGPPVTVLDVENILNKARNGYIPVKGNRNGHRDISSGNKQHHCLQAIPTKEQNEACDVILNKLRGKDSPVG
jgi:hypothetical protein